MMKSVEELLQAVQTKPDEIDFSDVISVIDTNYSFTTTSFTCGDAVSAAGSNEGSCKILAFGKKQGLSEAHTLALFGKFYREDVLQNPQGDDHANIRNFMESGFSGVSFDQEPLN